MEVIGVAASFIAIGQALVAGRHVVNLLRDIPRISNELASLNNEVESLRVAVEAARMQGVIALGDDPEPPDLRLARHKIIETANELEKFCKRCTRATDKDGKVKPRKTKWFLLQKELRECRDKARVARESLQLALLTLNLKCTNHIFQSTLRIESFTIGSTYQSIESQEAISISKRIIQADSSPSGVVETYEQQSIVSPIQDLQQNMTRLAVSDSSTSHYSSDADMVVFKAKLSAPGRCPQPCGCRCHSSRPSTFSSVGWARNLVGHLFVAYDRKLTFGNNVECSETLCKGNKRSVVTFKYQFPAWLCSRYLSAQASMDILTGLSASLRPVRVLPMNDGVIASMRERGREAVQWYMQNENLIFPDDRHCDGVTALEWAIRGGTADALEFLIEFWVEQLRKDSYNPDWYFAAKLELRRRPFMPEQKERALRVITSFGEDIVDAVQTPLHDAACIVDDDPRAKQEIRDAFSKYPWAINQWNYEGSTPLTLASECGSLEAVRELMSVGCDINCSDYAGQTALMRAAANGHPRIVQCLLDAGCPVDATSSRGRTALMDAANPAREPDGDPTEIIRILLSAGASTKTRDLWGDTVLTYFGMRETTAAATEAKFHLLLAAGADINSCNAFGFSPLQNAVGWNSKYVTRNLIEAGAEVQWFRQYRVNLLHDVALSSRLEAMQQLASMQLPRLNTDMLDGDGFTPWDCFIYTIYWPEWKLGGSRRPNPEEIECFVSLYKTMREQNLQLDIERLQRTHQYLADANQHGASAALEPLIKEKKEWKQWESVSTYKTILLQVKQEMWEAAIESVDENIEVLQERLAQDPWDQESKFDYLKYSSSEDSEDEVSSLGSDESEYQDCEEDEGNEVRDHN